MYPNRVPLRGACEGSIRALGFRVEGSMYLNTVDSQNPA